LCIHAAAAAHHNGKDKFTHARWAAGPALLAALAAVCGTAAAAHSAAHTPPAAAHHHRQSRPVHAAVPTPPAPPATAPAHTGNPDVSASRHLGAHWA
jgi:hypothetical protein